MTEYCFTDFFFVCLCLFSSWVNNFGHEGLGLLLDALEKLLDKKQWVVSSDIPSLCGFYYSRFCSCNHPVLFTVCFLGKRLSINGTSINSSNAWKRSWTIRLVSVNDDETTHTSDWLYTVTHFKSVHLHNEMILLGCNLKQLKMIKNYFPEMWLFFVGIY